MDIVGKLIKFAGAVALTLILLWLAGLGYLYMFYKLAP